MEFKELLAAFAAKYRVEGLDGADGADVIARFTGMPKGDYNCRFASFLRTSEMKTANDQVRALFLKSVAGLSVARSSSRTSCATT